MNIINNKKFETASPHGTKFWTGEVLEGNPELAKKLTLKDESEQLSERDGFKIIRYKKTFAADTKETIINVLKEVDFLLVPALFASLSVEEFVGIPRGKIVAFNATPETVRSEPQNKIASDKLTLIW